MRGFDFQPRLTSDLVSLRPLAPDDWTALYRAASDPLIWAGHPAHDRWQEPVFRRFFDDGLASGGALVAADPASGALIGSSRFDCARAGPGEVEIGWTFLVRDRWGGATNGAMKRLMIAHALDHFERVVFLIGEHNIRSRRAIARIGGVLTPRVSDAVLAGQPVRHLIYTIDRDGFAGGPLSGGER